MTTEQLTLNEPFKPCYFNLTKVSFMRLAKLTHYHDDTALLNELRTLIAPSYKVVDSFALKGLVAPEDGMQHELYTIRKETGDLVAFYTVGYHHVEYTLCCYLGLSAVRDDCKGQGLGMKLWSTHFQDCRQMEHRIGHRILLYFTTASPLPFAWFTRTLIEPAPTATGHCDELGRQRLRTVASSQYPQADWDANMPYLLHRAAPGVHYSSSEEKRLAEITGHEANNFFTSTRLDKRGGDRLLVVGFAPEII